MPRTSNAEVAKPFRLWLAKGSRPKLQLHHGHRTSMGFQGLISSSSRFVLYRLTLLIPCFSAQWVKGRSSKAARFVFKLQVQKSEKVFSAPKKLDQLKHFQKINQQTTWFQQAFLRKYNRGNDSSKSKIEKKIILCLCHWGLSSTC